MKRIFIALSLLISCTSLLVGQTLREKITGTLQTAAQDPRVKELIETLRTKIESVSPEEKEILEEKLSSLADRIHSLDPEEVREKLEMLKDKISRARKGIIPEVRETIRDRFEDFRERFAGIRR